MVQFKRNSAKQHSHFIVPEILITPREYNYSDISRFSFPLSLSVRARNCVRRDTFMKIQCDTMLLMAELTACQPARLFGCLLRLPSPFVSGYINMYVCLHRIFKYRWKFVCILYEIKCRCEPVYIYLFWIHWCGTIRIPPAQFCLSFEAILL